MTRNNRISITRRLEFDAGHRIPNHAGGCRNLHGHRYALEVTLAGQPDRHSGRADEGMVLDYGEVKAIMAGTVVDRWDHAFLAHREDHAVVDFLASLPEHRTVLLEEVPTAENLAALAFSLLDDAFRQRFGQRLRLERVRLYETPNSWADAVGAPDDDAEAGG